MENKSLAKVNIHIPDYALRVMERIESAGEDIYIVGGSLRDALLGLSANDYDMACSALPERTEEILHGFRIIETGLKHGTLTVICDSNPIEITTFRVDGEYLDSRRPEKVSFTRSIDEDLARRDFTVNAMAYSKNSGLIDLFGGEDDLQKKLIRAVGDPRRRFDEDALRIMRAFRFSAQLGFDIEDGTLEAAGALKGKLDNISRERIGAEFLRLICSDYPEKPLLQMKALGIFPFVTGGFVPDEKLFAHLSLMPKVAEARLGFLLFDADTEQAREVCSLLKCSNKQKSGALAVAKGAHKKIATPKDAALLKAAVGEYDRICVKASVLLGISEPQGELFVENNSAPSCIGDLAIGGAELVALGLCGKEIGEMLDFLLEAVINDPALNTREKLVLTATEKLKEKGE